jgi:hypothetical protein
MGIFCTPNDFKGLTDSLREELLQNGGIPPDERVSLSILKFSIWVSSLVAPI